MLLVKNVGPEWMASRVVVQDGQVCVEVTKYQLQFFFYSSDLFAFMLFALYM